MDDNLTNNRSLSLNRNKAKQKRKKRVEKLAEWRYSKRLRQKIEDDKNRRVATHNMNRLLHKEEMEMEEEGSSSQRPSRNLKAPKKFTYDKIGGQPKFIRQIKTTRKDTILPKLRMNRKYKEIENIATKLTVILIALLQGGW